MLWSFLLIFKTKKIIVFKVPKPVKNWKKQLTYSWDYFVLDRKKIKESLNKRWNRSEYLDDNK